jgi:phosphatidylethanolamine/phosphatidyl-N-methylethanolamine N-methyltransferase
MSQKNSFLKQFFKDKRMVGAMRPSSRFLSEKMLRPIDFEQAEVIVELGPGTGVFTKEILRKMKPNASLLVFELNDEFFKQISHEIKDPRAILIHDSAEHIDVYLKKHQLSEADYVVSSLPLAVFPQQLKQNILEKSYDCLKVGGKYIQFQYSLNAKKMLKSKFHKMNITFTPLNFPPAFVYTCLKVK